MARPTEKLVQRSQKLIGEPVEFAVRISYGPSKHQGHSLLRWIWNVFTFPHRLLFMATGRSNDKYLADSEGVLALMADGSYLVLSTSRRSTLVPVEIRQSFPSGAPLLVNKSLFNDVLVCEFTIDGFTATIHRADVKALMRATEAGRIERPEFAELLPGFLEYMSSGMASDDPMAFIEGRPH